LSTVTGAGSHIVVGGGLKERLAFGVWRLAFCVPLLAFSPLNSEISTSYSPCSDKAGAFIWSTGNKDRKLKSLSVSAFGI
jgi:hypothetical protein